MAQPSDRARQAAPTRIAAAERLLGTVVDIVAAILVVAEVAILFAGIVARYVLHAPLTWSDELASTLFLWLAMLGAVVALRRGEHNVSRLNAPARAWFDSLAIAAGLGFVLLIAAPAYRWSSEEAAIGARPGHRAVVSLLRSGRSRRVPAGAAGRDHRRPPAGR